MVVAWIDGVEHQCLHVFLFSYKILFELCLLFLKPCNLLSSGAFGGQEYSRVKLSDIHAVMNPRVGTFKFCLSVCLPSTIDFEHRDQLLFNPYH